MLNHKEVIDSFYKITCTATSTRSDSRVENNDYFKRRILGFKAEIEFEKEIKNSFAEYKFLEGGQFISKPLSGEASDVNNFFYSTFDYLAPEEYLEIYKRIVIWKDVKEMMYIQILKDNWTKEEFTIKEDQGGERRTTEILTPSYIFYTFDKDLLDFKKDPTLNFSSILNSFQDPQRAPNVFHLRKKEQFKYLEHYDIDTLKKIYATRYFMDHRKRKKVGVNMLDLDGFIVKNQDIKLIEIKEKSPIKKKGNKESSDLKDWSYGWDTRRLIWYEYLDVKVGLPVVYVVRQIDNRFDRNFIQWDAISIKDFLKATTWSFSTGGGGGADTLTAPYLHFQRLNKAI